MDCALKGNAKVYTLYPKGHEKNDVITFFEAKKGKIRRLLTKDLNDKKGIKWYITLGVSFIKTMPDGEIAKHDAYFRNFCTITLNKSTLSKQLRRAYAHMLRRFADWLSDGSGWVLGSINKLELRVARYKPLKGSNYVRVPFQLRKKKAIVNVKNNDEFCFVWAILSAQYPSIHNPSKVASYRKHFRKLNLSGLTFPLPVKQVNKFEKQNNLHINVFHSVKGEVFPLYLSKLVTGAEHKSNNIINLLLLRNKNKTHYCWIKDFSRLLREQGNYSNRRHYCYYCLHAFTKKEILERHVDLCRKQDFQKIKLPGEDSKWLEFKNHFKQDRVKFVIYADFECLLCPVQNCENDGIKSSTLQTHKHEPCAYSYVIVSNVKSFSKPPVVYRGPNPVKHLINALLLEQENILDVLYRYQALKMSKSDWDDFLNSKICHICKKEVKVTDLRVRDHDHVTSRYRGLAHAHCNIRYKLSKKIPVVFHNLKNYDSHIILQGMKLADDELKVKCIANNMEKYITFSIGQHLTFIDSFQFLSSSLDELVSNLAKEGPSKFKILTRAIDYIEPSLLLRKQVFPYNYLDSWERLEERGLPSRDKFYSDLTEEHISQSDYEHAQTMWNTAQMQTLGDMCEFYVMTDTLLLACVFENFRTLCLQYYGLDPLHYVSLPGLTFDACLKFTGAKLELFTSPEPYLFLEAGMRGGISMISHRYAKANNPITEGYNPDMQNSYIVYYDVNGLYSWALCQPLPLRDFKWVDEGELKHLDIANLGHDQIGYILEVDLEYPENLHDSHNHYPLAPERMKIEEEALSPYLKNLLASHDIKYSSSTEKLVPNLNDKKSYIVYYRTLQRYISLGLKVTKVHRALQFYEEAWVKPYVEFNIQKRKEATNRFEQDMFKLLNNSLFGKTMENVRKRKDVHLVTDAKVFQKMVRKPNFDAFRLFSKNLVGVNMKHLSVFLNKPIYIGFCILDNSKALMYDLHYNFIRARYGDNAILLFTDTDSLCYLIITKDAYLDMLENTHLLDTSNYDKGHFLFSMENKKEVGLLKDETGGKPILEFVGLRPKMYSILLNDATKKVAKGVKKTTINKHLRHNEYKRALFYGERFVHKMTSIQSKEHQLFTVSINKTSLCPMDDKRYLLDDGITSLAYGHYSIR